MKKRFLTGGVAPVVLPLVILVTMLVSGDSLAQTLAQEREIPSPSKGDIIFYADVVTFYGGDGSNIEEIYCIVPNEQIKFLEKDGLYEGRLKYVAKILGQDGNVIGAKEKTLEVTAASVEDALDRSVVQVLESRISVPPGRYTAHITLEDLNAIKKTILSYVLRRHKKGEIRVQIESKRFKHGEVSISDIEFARSLRRTSLGAFRKSGFEIIPNAQRRYGLLLPELAMFFEVYDLRPGRNDDTLSVSYSIINRTGNEIFRSDKRIALVGESSGSTALFDVTSLAAGSYLLRLNISDDEGRVLAYSDRKFDVVWSVVSWGRYEAEMIGDMAYVFTEEEMETFESLSPGEQEEFLREFWLKIDPTPGTVQNEALEEHYRRVRYADRHFGGAHARGALTDRGRLYIKYGPPDDVQSFYSDYEFVKGTRDIEGGGEPFPTDPFSRVGLKTGSPAAGSWDQAGSKAEAYSDQRGGTTVHGKSYEIWSYDGAGQPVRRLAGRIPSSAGMRFILVDERGIGQYKLVYSTEKQEY